jgi:hypothetical protein
MKMLNWYRRAQAQKISLTSHKKFRVFILKQALCRQEQNLQAYSTTRPIL